jgi:hypothetical protein
VTSGAQFRLGDVIPDGAGGAYFLWEDGRTAANGLDIYAQRLTATGVSQWGTNGTAVCAVTGDQTSPSGVPVASGGVLLGWSDARSVDAEVFVQRLDESATPQLAVNGFGAYTSVGVQRDVAVIATDDGGTLVFWNEKVDGEYDIRARKFAADGTPVGGPVSICAAPGHQLLEAAIDDGAGGAILAWTDRRNGNDDIYAQRVNSSAVPQWTANGVAACTAVGSQSRPRIVPDGTGGVILTWEDARVESANPNIFAQRIDHAGTPQWGVNGTVICDDNRPQLGPALASDGAGGATIFWTDLRGTFSGAIYAQRVNGSGTPLWTANGLKVVESSPGSRVSAAPATSNGAIVLVNQFVPGTTGDAASYLMAQRLTGAGAALWGSGVVVSTTNNFCASERIVEDGSGGAFVAWSDTRNGAFDVFAQHITSGGTIQWVAGIAGIPVCAATGWQYLGGLTRDASGNSYYTWSDQRSGELDVYAQKLSSSGVSQWTADGVLVCGSAHGQFGAAVAPWKQSTSCRVYTAWTDNRAGNERYVFQQRLDCAGQPQWASDGVTSTLLSLIAAEANAHSVRLEWYSAEPMSAAVYRSTSDGTWTRIGDATSDGEGHLTFLDTDVEPGTRYSYRLSVTQGGVETFSEITWVDVPASLEFALEGLRPNPTAEEPVVAFTLGRAGDASLEVLDLAGRRVAHRDLLGLEPGRHVMRVGRALPPGVYMISLSQAGERRTARAVVRR